MKGPFQTARWLLRNQNSFFSSASDKLDSGSASEWLELSPGAQIQAWYRECYHENAYSGGAGQIQRAMHRSLERGYTAEDFFQMTLELGANFGEHLPYVRHKYSKYFLTDVSDNWSQETKRKLTGLGVVFEKADAQELPYDDGSFDRVLHTCVLHHLSDPERALSEIRRVMKLGGTADIFLSADPGFLFRLGRYLGPYRSAKNQGLGEIKSLVDARDHMNHSWSLRRLIRHVFRHDHIVERAFPIGKLPMDLCLWRTYRIRRL